MNRKKTTKFVVFLGLTILSVFFPNPSEAEDDILPKEPILDTAEKSSLNSAEKEVSENDIQQSDKGFFSSKSNSSKGTFSVGLFGGFAFNKYSTSGSGFHLNLPFEMGSVFGLSLSHESSSKRYSTSFVARRVQNEVANVPSITPSTVSVQRVQAYLRGELHVFDSMPSFGILFGYTYQNRSSDITVPRIAVSSAIWHGPMLGVGFKREGSFVTLAASAEVGTPLFYKESSASTGTRNWTLFSELNLGAHIKVGSRASIGLVPFIRIDYQKFEGAGTRGTFNAGEQDLIFAIPVEVRFSF